MKCEACLNAWLSALKTVCFLFFFLNPSHSQLTMGFRILKHQSESVLVGQTVREPVA